MADNTIDPRFFLPPNVVNLGYKEISSETSDGPVEAGIFENDAIVAEISYTDDMEGTFDSKDESRMLPPDYITVVSQTARVTSGGTVVDVVIDVEDIANVGQFEVRLTK